MAKPGQEDQFDDRETARRSDAVIKRMIATPPKPHSEMKVGKRPPQHRVAKKKPATAKKKRPQRQPQ